jgi:hypothetical protein
LGHWDAPKVIYTNIVYDIIYGLHRNDET